MALSLQEVLKHGHAELDMAEQIISQHQQTRLLTVCTCGRMWECGVNVTWSKYAAYWRARLIVLTPHPVHGPTVLLPLVVKP